MYPKKKWNDVLKIVSGKNQKEVENPDGKYPIYGSGGIIGRANAFLCDANTVIVGRKGTIDNPIYVNEPFWNIDTAFGVVAGNQLLPKYLFFFCRLFNFKALDKSTGRPSIAKSDLLKIEMPIPPLEEQQRIVSHIEELFSELDNAEETLLKTKELLALYKQSVLNEVLVSDDKKTINDCMLEMTQGWSPKCQKEAVESDDVWAVITTTAIQAMNFMPYENKKLPDELEPREKHEIQVGDILITRAGPRSRCGVCCLVRQTKKKLINCDKVYRLRVDNNVILPEFMEAVLNAPSFQKEIAFCKTGGNDSGVNLTQDRFLNIQIPVPTKEMQEKMLQEIDERISIFDFIEQTVNTSLQQILAMRQSILKEAFEGRLS